MTIACKVSGAGTHVANVPALDNINESRDVRWYLLEDSATFKTLVVGGRSSVRRVAMLDAQPATPKEVQHVMGARWLGDGIVAGRFSSKPGLPVDVELASFSLETGRVQHTKLPKLAPFRVASYGFTGDVQIAPGGMLYQSTDAAQLLFVHEDGKIDRMSPPAHTMISQAQHLGNAWLLFDTPDRQMARLTWTTDGATWQQRAWIATGANDANVSIIRGGGRSWISTNTHEGLIFYPLTAPMPNEMPMPIAPDPAAMDATCDPHAPYAESFLMATHGGTVHATVDYADKKPARAVNIQQRITHAMASGALCTTGFAFTSYGTNVVLYRDGKTLFGWSFRTPDDGKGKIAEPLACTVSP